MALPNKLFNPVLSTCISALVLLLLLLLFLLYKYNQVRFPAAGQGLQGLPSPRGHTACAGSQGRTIQLGGTRRIASFTSPASQLALEFPAAGRSSCTQPGVLIPLLPWSFSPVAQRSAWLLFGVRQRYSLCAANCSWFCSGPHKSMD